MCGLQFILGTQADTDTLLSTVLVEVYWHMHAKLKSVTAKLDVLSHNRKCCADFDEHSLACSVPCTALCNTENRIISA